MNKNTILDKEIINFYLKSKPYIDRAISKGYDEKWIAVFKGFVLKIEKYFSPDSLVLDLGCGAGWTSRILNEVTNSTIIGMDLSSEMILSGAAKKESISFMQADKLNNLIKAQAISKGKIHFTSGDACNIPFNNQLFDVVTSYASIEHIYDAASALKEMLRVLKINGFLIISAPNMISLFRWLKIFLSNLIKGESHPDGTLTAGYRFVLLNIQKLFSKVLVFSYREPVLCYDKYLGPNYDATYLVNPFDLKKFALQNNLSILNMTDISNRSEKALKFLFPKFCSSILFIAQKNMKEDSDAKFQD